MRTWLVRRYILWSEEIYEELQCINEMFLDVPEFESWDIEDKVRCKFVNALYWWHNRVVQPFMMKVLRLTHDEVERRMLEEGLL